MQFDELKLLPGTRVKIAGAGGEGGLPSVTGKYVGCQRPLALIVAVPEITAGGALRLGTRVACSLVTPTGIVNFVSQIEGVSHSPFPHVFLAYPKIINMRNVRSAVRVNVDIEAQVANLESLDLIEMLPTRVIDMSVSGLKLGSPVPLGEVGDEVAVHMQLIFEDIERHVTLPGQIRAQTQAQIDAIVGQSTHPFVVGIEFLSLDEDKRVLLHAFVFYMVQRFGAQV